MRSSSPKWPISGGRDEIYFHSQKPEIVKTLLNSEWLAVLYDKSSTEIKNSNKNFVYE